MGDCIVDTCVLRGAGTSAAPASVACMSVIQVIEEMNYFVVCSKELWEEWQRHVNRISTLWVAQMMSKGQILFYLPARHHEHEIGVAIQGLPNHQRAVALKDAHVISLAVAANALVVSCEVACRTAFVSLGRIYPPVASVYWVSPLTSEELVDWLRAPGQVPLGWLLRV